MLAAIGLSKEEVIKVKNVRGNGLIGGFARDGVIGGQRGFNGAIGGGFLPEGITGGGFVPDGLIGGGFTPDGLIGGSG